PAEFHRLFHVGGAVVNARQAMAVHVDRTGEAGGFEPLLLFRTPQHAIVSGNRRVIHVVVRNHSSSPGAPQWGALLVSCLRDSLSEVALPLRRCSSWSS